MSKHKRKPASDEGCCYYAVDSADGTELTTGLQEHEARRVAQAIADRIGDTVYLYAVRERSGVDDEPDEPVDSEAIEPTVRS